MLIRGVAKLSLSVLIMLIGGCVQPSPKINPPQDFKSRMEHLGATVLETKDTLYYEVLIRTTLGDIQAKLDVEYAPQTVANFIKLTRNGFYNGVLFHRVIPGFMIQTGDPTGTGRGGPGYTFADEFSDILRHDKPGVLSMANHGPNTNGSQFFITVKPTPWLDDRHSVFGYVQEGMDVVMKIAQSPRDDQDRPLEAIRIEHIYVLQDVESMTLGETKDL